jgi:group I intron endonuclease
MKICGIYGIFNTANSKVLVGSSNNISKRFGCHKSALSRGVHYNDHFQLSWNKYGKDSFEFRVLEACPLQMLLIRENVWMEYYKSLSPKFGYNMQNATRTFISEELRKNMIGSHGISPEHKAKLLTYHLGIPMPDHVRKAIDRAVKGKKRSKEFVEKLRKRMTGFKHTKASKAKMSLAKQSKPGHPHTEEFKKMMSEKMTGRRLSEETKRKLSQVRSGVGHPHSEKTKQKMSESKKGKPRPQHVLDALRAGHVAWINKMHHSTCESVPESRTA